MSAVLVRQSLSLARAEAERMQSDMARQCVDELQQTLESAMTSSPMSLLGTGGSTSAAAQVSLRGARLTTDTGAVLSPGTSPMPGAAQACTDGFNSAQHRVSVSLPSVDRPTLQVIYAAAQGPVRTGRVVEYQLDSVSNYQVWSQELLDVERLFSLGPEIDESDGSGTGSQPELQAGGTPTPVGVVGISVPSRRYDITTQMADLDEMAITFDAPGNRRYRITSVIYPLASTPAEVVAHQIVRNGLAVQGGLGVLANDTNVFTHELSVIDVPAAGRVVYRSRARFADTTGLNYSRGDFRPFIMVEDVGPAVLDDPERTAPDNGALGLLAVAPDRFAPGFSVVPATQMTPIAGATQVAQAAPGQPLEVTFTPAPGRRYKIVSLVHPWAPDSAGALFTHTIARQAGSGAPVPVRSGLVMAGNGTNALSHQLEAVDAGPFSADQPVTYSTRLSVTGAQADTFNYADTTHLPFIAVFDVGPASLEAGPGSGPAGVIAIAGSSGASPLGPEPTETAQLQVVTDGTRMLRIVSSPQAASAMPGDVALHQLGRNGRVLRAGLVALDNDRNPVTHQLSTIETPSSGQITYQTLLRFSQANQNQGASLSQGSFTPLLYVEDLGQIGANVSDAATVLAGAIYGAAGVQVPALTSNIVFGRSEARPDASPRHLQIISPNRNPGPSFQPNVSTYTDVDADARLPSSSGAPGRIPAPGGTRMSGVGTRDQDSAPSLWSASSASSASSAAHMQLDSTQLAAQTADRVNLACADDRVAALCLQPGQLLLPELSRARRPVGAIGFATPDQGFNFQFNQELDTLTGHEVSLLSDGARMYRITSTVNPLSLLPGETVAHRIARNGIDIQGGLHTLENTQNAFNNTLVTFDVPPPGLITYATRARFAGDPDGTNLSAAGVRPFLLVEDLGPAQGSVTPSNGAAGIKALVMPAVSSSGYSQSPQAAPGQQITFQAESGRRYAIVSSIRPLSSVPGNVVTHDIRRSSAAGAIPVAAGRVGLANTVNISTHTVTTIVEPDPGPVTYATFLSFAAGSGGQNVNYADSVHRPLLAVVDIGPATPTDNSLVSVFPAGLVAGPVTGGVASFVAAQERLYRVDFSATFSSDRPGDVARLDLVRIVAGQETVAQRGLVPASQVAVTADRTFTVLDAPGLAEGTAVVYELRPVFAAGDATRTLSTSLWVEDVGRASTGSGAVGADGEVVGVVGSASTFRRPMGLVRASFAALDGQQVATVPTEVIGQNVTFEAAGGRRYKITSVLQPFSTLPAEMLRHEIVRSATNSDNRVVQASLHPLGLADAVDTSTVVVFDTPPQGRVTYTTRAQFAQSGALLSSGSARSFIVVEDVGPVADGIVPDDGSAGLIGRIGYADPDSFSQVFSDTWVDVPGQQVSFAADPQRRYLLVSSVRPTAAPELGARSATVAGHRVVRTVGGQDQVVSEHLVNLANDSNVFAHTFDYLDTPGSTGVVTYRTQMRFFFGAGRNYRDLQFRPFLAVQDAGPAPLADPAPAEPAGTLGIWPAGVASTVQATVTEATGELEAAVTTVTVPGGRLYRVAANLHPAFEDDVDAGGPASSFTFQLLRNGVPVQTGAGYLADGGTAFSHRLEAIDAPAASSQPVTYQARLTFPTGVGYSVATGTFRPQLFVEDLGPAQLDTVFAFDAQNAPSALIGGLKPTLLSRVPEDATSYRVTFAPDDDGGTSILVESCPSPVCTIDKVTSSLTVPLPRSGLVVIPGHTSVFGVFSQPVTLIAGTLTRPADLVVSTSASFISPVQLVATDRMLVQVADGSRPSRIDADLVALGLGSDGPALGAASLGWSAQLTLAGALAAPSVDLEEAFGQSGPTRLEPRRHTAHAPWAIGFSSQWEPTRTHLPSPALLETLLGR